MGGGGKPADEQANEDLYSRLERYEITLAQTENVLFAWDMETDNPAHGREFLDFLRSTTACVSV